VGASGQTILETLFVRLVKPPREINRPVNVVSIGRTSNHVTCLLRDDSLLSLTREQVMVLPNFAMTDYASQGKSRDRNVAHLNNSKNHYNYYVALSRGYTADGTAIMQGFDSNKITCGISGHLRQTHCLTIPVLTNNGASEPSRNDQNISLSPLVTSNFHELLQDLLKGI
jgi:hypothetical protein